jgi:target of EGR1 protein 1
LGIPKRHETSTFPITNRNIEDRYIALADVAKNYSVNAVGLSLYEKTEIGYKVNNFHFVMLSIKDHLISPSSISFLIQHGFDFNDQFRNG